MSNSKRFIKRRGKRFPYNRAFELRVEFLGKCVVGVRTFRKRCVAMTQVKDFRERALDKPYWHRKTRQQRERYWRTI